MLKFSRLNLNSLFWVASKASRKKRREREGSRKRRTLLSFSTPSHSRLFSRAALAWLLATFSKGELASQAGVFRGACFSSLPTSGSRLCRSRAWVSPAVTLQRKIRDCSQTISLHVRIYGSDLSVGKANINRRNFYGHLFLFKKKKLDRRRGSQAIYVYMKISDSKGC